MEEDEVLTHEKEGGGVRECVQGSEREDDCVRDFRPRENEQKMATVRESNFQSLMELSEIEKMSLFECVGESKSRR